MWNTTQIPQSKMSSDFWWELIAWSPIYYHHHCVDTNMRRPRVWKWFTCICTVFVLSFSCFEFCVYSCFECDRRVIERGNQSDRNRNIYTRNSERDKCNERWRWTYAFWYDGQHFLSLGMRTRNLTHVNFTYTYTARQFMIN